MKGRIPLGAWAGVPVGAHWSVLVAVVLVTRTVAVVVLPSAAPGRPASLYWVVGALVAVAFFASLAAHELAHTVVARLHGVGVRRIDLWLLGGVSQLEGRPPSPRADFLIAVAGPVTSAVVAAGSAGVAALVAALGGGDLATTAVLWLAFANGVLAVFNLLPAAPLDGGRVLRALVWWRTGSRARGERTATDAGRGFGFVLLVGGLVQLVLGSGVGVWWMLMGAFVLASAGAERRQSVVREVLGSTPVATAMRADVAVAPGWWTVQAFLEQRARQVPQRVFPVVSFDGDLVGVTSLPALAELPEQRRLTTRVADVSRPPTAIADPDEPLADVLTRARLSSSRDVVVVVRDHHVLGVVSAHDVRRAVELATAGVTGG
ncbi:site-2 protease family protein [Saccharothrix variisporea]|uniref:Zinc metalloprotease n=1 Tax=Saccharothrix variisporea TaxID=543527 RepID=A0A495XLH2_9PSEU|nr:site-2 protease family protein [Saccharothrix variisporea]RKT74509.1 Zn-dependent protease [Saccharothrix variisporea]